MILPAGPREAASTRKRMGIKFVTASTHGENFPSLSHFMDFHERRQDAFVLENLKKINDSKSDSVLQQFVSLTLIPPHQAAYKLTQIELNNLTEGNLTKVLEDEQELIQARLRRMFLANN